MTNSIAMRLGEWRKANGKTLREIGEALGLSPTNPSRTAQRIEQGAVKVDADLAEAIASLTGDAVRPQDLHETRLAWLRANPRVRPEDEEAGQ